MASFSFSFSGDDIEDDGETMQQGADAANAAAAAAAAAAPPPASSETTAPAASAFPVQGKPQLPARRHDLQEMLARLPSKIAYGLLRVALEDDGAGADADTENTENAQAPPRGGAAPARRSWVSLPRRELWDVRVQLMAEDDRMGEGQGEGDGAGEGDASVGLGTHDVKTGIYEGGFKSWESSIDLVKVLLRGGSSATTGPSPSAVAAGVLETGGPAHVVELGCGTALPSVALFQWLCSSNSSSSTRGPVSITVADYNPSVLYLVTLPNFLLAWALQQRAAGHPLLQQAVSVEADSPDGGGELELTDAVKDAFCAFLAASGTTLSFLSGGWSPAFVDLLYAGRGGAATGPPPPPTTTLVLGAETIYSPFALEAFSDTLLAILRRERRWAMAIVGAKKLYFGVGGSLGDFAVRMADAGAAVRELSEETEGVRRGVVQCVLE